MLLLGAPVAVAVAVAVRSTLMDVLDQHVLRLSCPVAVAARSTLVVVLVAMAVAMTAMSVGRLFVSYEALAMSMLVVPVPVPAPCMVGITAAVSAQARVVFVSRIAPAYSFSPPYLLNSP